MILKIKNICYSISVLSPTFNDICIKYVEICIKKIIYNKIYIETLQEGGG